jgi:transposase
MNDQELYAKILGVSTPWMVADVDLDLSNHQVNILVEPESDAMFACLACGKSCSRYDSRERKWRHLDTCQYKTILVCRVPRVRCPEHGVQQVLVPWAEPNSRFTGHFEALVINWLRTANIKAVAELMTLTWVEVDGIMKRAVARGLRRRGKQNPTAIGVDETSFQKRHEYVTVVVDLHESAVLHVANDRKEVSLGGLYDGLDASQRENIEVVAMDMHVPYIEATMKAVPGAEKKIAFDRFHVAKHIGDAVDKVRREEHKALMAKGDFTLKGSKHVWLSSEENLTNPVMQHMLDALREAGLRTGDAHALKESARYLWRYVSRGWAKRAWNDWIGWAMRSGLEPMAKAAQTVGDHLWGIINAVVLGVTNAAAESTNAKIQRIKGMACGFRSRERFRNAIYFHLGNLDLYPDSENFTHTNN